MPNVSTNDTKDSKDSQVDCAVMDMGQTEPAMKTSTKKTERSTGKPTPGSVEWYEIRKENHKKVERKRRETINQAMLDLGKVIPGNEKNKSRILSRAVQHIQGLVEEVVGLRQQVDQYREANLKYQNEIADLKARLEAQGRHQDGDLQQRNSLSPS
ncbi:uncharacterized protein BX664DRAFT_329522 [Halteromyces radiatus]|uniref:uncharacterized protein n=1 Tax=Halteromyces radiatus TaxID=101107 RepID=UPI002220CC61|nr:uncharacterized protein BX664DRAFT_329522 [Halteromyces radiatus]KAI8093368.1 hypothetical protein BX664DRAFT_329522 [Halteromyces radiatus]